jgi:hypothetical protein
MDIDNRAIKREIKRGLGTIGRIKIVAELVKKPNGSFTKYALLLSLRFQSQATLYLLSTMLSSSSRAAVAATKSRATATNVARVTPTHALPSLFSISKTTFSKPKFGGE